MYMDMPLHIIWSGQNVTDLKYNDKKTSYMYNQCSDLLFISKSNNIYNQGNFSSVTMIDALHYCLLK